MVTQLLTPEIIGLASTFGLAFMIVGTIKRKILNAIPLWVWIGLLGLTFYGVISWGTWWTAIEMFGALMRSLFEFMVAQSQAAVA